MPDRNYERRLDIISAPLEIKLILSRLKHKDIGNTSEMLEISSDDFPSAARNTW
jgi:hypothetical protein